MEEGNPISMMAKHLTFTIFSVNTSKQTICGTTKGFNGSWTPPIDFLGKRLLLQEIIRVVLQTNSCPILTELNGHKELLMECLGMYHYLHAQTRSSQVNAQEEGTPHQGQERSQEDQDQGRFVLPNIVFGIGQSHKK